MRACGRPTTSPPSVPQRARSLPTPWPRIPIWSSPPTPWPGDQAATDSDVESDARRGLQDDDGTQHVAPLHAREGLLHAVEGDGLGDEQVQIEATGEVEVNQHGKVSRGQAVAVPAGLEHPAAAEEIDHRQI